MQNITWPTVEGYDLKVDNVPQGRAVHLHYTNQTNPIRIVVHFAHDRNAKVYTTDVRLGSVHFGPRNSYIHRAEHHTPGQLLAYVRYHVESGWLAATVSDLVAHAPEILQVRRELVDAIHEVHPFNEVGGLDELTDEAVSNLTARAWDTLQARRRDLADV